MVSRGEDYHRKTKKLKNNGKGAESLPSKNEEAEK